MGIKFLGNSEKQNPLLLAWKFGNRPMMLRPGTGNSTAAIGSPDQVNSSTAERQAVEDALAILGVRLSRVYTGLVSYTSLRRSTLRRRSLVQSDDSHRRPVYAAQQYGGYRQVAT